MAHVGKQSLASAYPNLLEEWHPTKNGDIDPTFVMPGSGKKAWWVCKTHGHEWEAIIGNRTKGVGCPVCSGRLVHVGFNDLSTLRPDLAIEWHPTKNGNLTPLDVTTSAAKKVWWQCEQGHEWFVSISNRSGFNSKCPFCQRKKVLPGFNDLLTTHPEIAAQWHPEKNDPLTPKDVFSGSARKIWWICSQGHAWESTLLNRSQGAQCSVCNGKQVLVGFNDLASVFPHMLNEWHPTKNHPLLPTDVTSVSGKKVWWQCKQGHEWQAFVFNRTRDKDMATGCPRCAQFAVSSKPELEIHALMTTLGVSHHQHFRLMIPHRVEVDFYLPQVKMALEFNGLYWHSEATGRGQNYHQSKQQACEAAGITLYQVWEDDWKSRREIVLRGIAHRLGVVDRLSEVLPDLPAYYTERVGARQTHVVSLSYQESSAFLEEHHIQSGALGTHYLGLNDKQERLRAVLVLKKTGKPGELSIERYATAGVVSGGFTKLLKHAEKVYQPSRWVTFADLAVSDGGLYENTGFHVDKILKPDYSYLVAGQRTHKFNYRLKRFRDDPTLLHQDGLTERELAALNGLVRVWDSGKVRYVKDVQVA